jgi:predicted membrane protein DUF2142
MLVRVARLPPWLPLVVGWVLLGLAWAMASAPFGAPDESEHYERAVSVSDGVMAGKEAPIPLDINTPSGRWFHQTARVVAMPAGLSPTNAACFAHDRNASAACAGTSPSPAAKTEFTIGVGGYQPLPYLAPAVALKPASAPVPALRLARLAGLLVALLMIGAAVAVLRAPDGDPLALLGPMAAVTPMVLYLASSLTGSGLEITSAIAFSASLLRLSRPGIQPRWIWAVAGISGSALDLSRAPGPLWLVIATVLVIALRGPRGSWRIAREGGRAALIAGAAVLIAVLFNRAWEAGYGIQDLPIGFEDPRSALRTSMTVLRDVAPQFIGKFGYLEFGLPRSATNTWFCAVALLVLAAFLVATWQQRFVLAGSVAMCAAVPMFMYIAIFRHTGNFGLQGRHVLGIVVFVSLLAGELLYRQRARLPAVASRFLVTVIPLAVAAVQFVAWSTVARRYATGLDGPVNILRNPEWSPPLGWGPWFALTVIGVAMIASVAAFGYGRRRPLGTTGSRPSCRP